MKTPTSRRSILTASIVAAFFAPVVPVFAHGGHAVVAQAPVATEIAETSAVMRDLWVGHIFWVRNVVVDTLARNKPSAAAAEKEVVANAKQIAAAIEPYYGKAASDKLFGLLAGHYGAVKEYVEATAEGSKANRMQRSRT